MEHATTSPVSAHGHVLPLESKSTARGLYLGRKLAEALGIAGQPWQKIVIVADVKDAARVYVKGLVYAVAADSIVQAVAEVTVSDEGEVNIVESK